MEEMNLAGDAGPSLQDSVVGGNLHTGDVIHNHYHVVQTSNTQQTVPSTAVQSSPITHTQGRVPNPAGLPKRELGLAYLFCIFFGIFGGHRFYLGQTTLGFVYLFTAGLFCIGWIVDLTRLPDLVQLRNRELGFEH